MQIDCLLEPILRFVRDTLLPRLPDLVYSLGTVFHHLTIPPQGQFFDNSGADGVSLCDAAKQEVLRQLKYQDSEHLSSTIWTDNDHAWEHARRLLVQMDREEMTNFLDQIFECCMCGTQVALSALLLYRAKTPPLGQLVSNTAPLQSPGLALPVFHAGHFKVPLHDVCR